MGWYDIINGFFSTSSGKVYRSQILNLPGSAFPRQVRLDIDGEQKYLVGENLRDFLAQLANSGITLTRLDEKLKDMGLENKQYQRREEIIKTLKNLK